VILDVSQPYRPPLPVPGIALLYFALLYFRSVCQISLGGKCWILQLSSNPTLALRRKVSVHTSRDLSCEIVHTTPQPVSASLNTTVAALDGFGTGSPRYVGRKPTAYLDGRCLS
jgi:hypothetical protein